MKKLRRLAHSVDQTRVLLTFEVLTPREREAMHFAAEGLTNKAIARHLRVSEGTVKLHLHSIYRKLGVKSRFALIALVNKAR